MDQWTEHIEDYKVFLRLEKSLSENTVSGYSEDLKKLIKFMEDHYPGVSLEEVGHVQLQKFIHWLNDAGLKAGSQARIISGIKGFFRFLLLDERISVDPAALLEVPRTGRHLPEVLSREEIDRVLSSVDLSKREGHRNRAMLEVLYGCGLRVSELVNLKLSGLNLKEGFVRIQGKGGKERLVPVGTMALRQLQLHLEERKRWPVIERGSEDILFLNIRGKKLSRGMIFHLVRELAGKAGIKKKISPHTFRHSFATHLIDGGADLRAVQEMLGHESILTTEIYTHLDREYLRDAIIHYHPRSGKGREIRS